MDCVGWEEREAGTGREVLESGLVWLPVKLALRKFIQKHPFLGMMVTTPLLKKEKANKAF